jgi:hypothetical protein
MKNWANAGAAKAFYTTMLASKLKKGYVTVGKAKTKFGSTDAKATIAKAKA